MMNLRFLFKKTNSLFLNVGYFSSHHQRDIMPCKQERIIVVSCASRTCHTRRVFMRYTTMRYIVSGALKYLVQTTQFEICCNIEWNIAFWQKIKRQLYDTCIGASLSWMDFLRNSMFFSMSKMACSTLWRWVCRRGQGSLTLLLDNGRK